MSTLLCEHCTLNSVRSWEDPKILTNNNDYQIWIFGNLSEVTWIIFGKFTLWLTRTFVLFNWSTDIKRYKLKAPEWVILQNSLDHEIVLNLELQKMKMILCIICKYLFLQLTSEEQRWNEAQSKSWFKMSHEVNQI